MAWTNPQKYYYLRKSDLGYLLKSDLGKIIIHAYPGTNIWPNQSKNSATFSNTSRNSGIWINDSKS
jgi:hypothetical protein